MPTWEQICARRVTRHGITEPLNGVGGKMGVDVAFAAGVMCGAHAQVLPAAELSICLRLQAATRVDVAEALWSSRTLIKSYGPRGTVHLLPARDLPMWTGALSSIPSRSGLPPTARLTEEQIDATVAAIGAALGAGPLTIEELNAEVIDRTGRWAAEATTPDFGGVAPRWRQALGVAANRGVLCFGPNRGRKVTYTRPPDFTPIEPAAAVRQLVTAYLRAYGPATPAHFAKWLAAPASWAEAALRGFQPTEHGHVVPGDDEWPDAGKPELRMLPYFDAYTIGAQPRDRVFAHADRALAHGQAGVYPVLLLGGTVCGIWHQRRSHDKLTLTVEPFGRLDSGRRRQLDEQVERIAAISEANVEMRIGEVASAPHK
jgi:hypothetical protein